jgi:tetratricopeptide (TPR) repeat protein
LEEAKATVNDALQHNLNGASLHIQLASIAWAQKDYAAVEKELGKAAASPDGTLSVLNFRALVAGARGQINSARGLTSKAMQAMQRLNLKEGPANALSLLAVQETVTGLRSAAIADANRAVSMSTTRDVQGSAAQALAFSGSEAKALALAEDIRRRRPNDTVAQYITIPLIKALVELQRGHPAQAMDLLDTAAVYARATDGLHYARGITYLRLGKGSEAVQEFQKVLDMEGFYGPDVLVSLAHLGLGRAYALQNDSSRARVAYQDFFGIWKDADADLPVLQEAKGEYNKLKS